ncbi:hypothetical protein CC86DRAFT_90526 [Ophiobolus disseminans]|uniref:F-box domain-containing protein n=1 Tax=Ophiobolus disseminans TaxID=1469910 RepID=A0A6A7AIH3_9PLEO|nr:hypothetical protein CC86DRAFT_90526 [Ophiobolus disseminans]
MVRTTLNYPSLPAELWGQILSYMDDFSLWVPCRQVSRMLRTEAEYAFARTRLPQLEIEWACTVKFWDRHVRRKYMYYGNLDNTGTEFLGLDASGTRECFHVPISYRVTDMSDEQIPLVPNHDELKERVMKALRNAEVNFASGLRSDAPAEMISTLSPFSNNNLMPGLDHGVNECSFDWKAFLNGFYADYAHVGKMTQPLAPFQAVLQRINAAERVFTLASNWIPDYGRLEDSLFKRAYMTRLERAAKVARSAAGVSARALPEVNEWVVYLRRRRYHSLQLCLMRKDKQIGST